MNCIINHEDKEITRYLTAMGLRLIAVLPSNQVSKPLNLHADILYLKTGDKKLLVSKCQMANVETLTNLSIDVEIFNNLSPGYLTESYLNIVITDDIIICNPKTATLNCEIFNNKKEIIKVNQGYTNCSTVAITSNAFITQDVGIYTALVNKNIDCLLVNNLNIKLEGYDSGFIGGATIMIEENQTLFFCGDINQNDEKNKIINFLQKYNVIPYFIKGKPLKDIGGGIII